jgi:amino acid transporter
MSTESGARVMTVRGAAFLGVGSMVGAGIFALLGEAGAVAGAAVWLSFLVAGGVAMLQGYAVAKLGARYPSSGGLVTFLLKGFGSGHTTSITSWLIYFATVIVTAMVSVSFGQYGSALLFGGSSGWSRILTIAVVLVVAAVNIAGARLIDRVQSAVAIVLIAVFAVFIVVTFTELNPDLLAPSNYPPFTHVVSSVALTFFAFLGFTVISFTGSDLENPERNLPRATYLALGITTALYVLIALGVFGVLTVQQVIDNGETALAIAAKPALGQAGFAMMAVAALLGTSSSVNANIYAATGSTAALAESGLFPPVFGQHARVGSTRGMVISVILVLLLANLVDLTAIASLGSVVALVIFLIVASAAYRLRAETASRTWVLIAGIALTALVLIIFAVQTLETAPQTFVAMIGILALAIIMDLAWRRVRKHRRA